MRLLLGCLAVLLPFAAARAAPLQALSPALLCEQAIAAAEFRGRTPPGMLAAIGHVESGRPDPDTGAIRPWPWTINVGGAGQYFATKAEAIAAVTALQAQGVRSIDVGCMQVNLMHHPDAFATLAAAFDPATNAAYAVRFLTQLDAQTGDWRRAVAAYHSNTPDIAADYQRRVLALWRPTPGTPGAPASAPATASGLTHEAGGALVYGTMSTSGRVFGLIMPTVRLSGPADGGRP